MTEKTIQLRQYDVDPAGLPAFIAWWRDELVPVRRAAGFTIESAYADHAAGRFTWAVSKPLGSAEFEAALQEWEDSPARAEVLAGRPTPILSSSYAIVVDAL